jgi:predicted ATPase
MVSRKPTKPEPTAVAPRVPDLEMLRAIGSGAFGEVWLARTLTGSYRAVKLVYRGHFKQDAPFEKEFHGILKYEPVSRSHDGLTDILQVGKNDAEDYFYYVMEAADDVGGTGTIDPDSYAPRTLAAEIGRRGRLPVDECLNIALALAAALDHLHKAGLVHRDIKPSNIIFVGGVPKLADIGLVTDIGQSSLVGTPGYIAPDGPGKPQADIYSLGKVLYEISTGRRAQEFPDLPTDLLQPTEGEKLVQLNEVILKACDANVQRRYQTAQQMYADLARLLRGRLPVVKRELEAVPNNLPAQLTSFVGREKEMEEIKQLLGKTRLLTLTGIGGTGKTRLALQLGMELLAEYGDGVWLVELAGLSDPNYVPQTTATVLGVREEPTRPLLATLLDQLHPKQLLLLLDNCEHLLDACAQLADALLKACPRVQIIATSREPLGMLGELAWRVPSMGVPDPVRLPPLERITVYEAVRLFTDRAQAVRPGFAVATENASAVAQICWQLDGIPLAIELAAARVRELTLPQIAEHLDERFELLTRGNRAALPRQQTLQAAIDWSYNLLSEAERVLFTRLSVFAGGWTLEAAEAVCAGDGIEPGAVLDLLTHLVDKSLVIAEVQGKAQRYGMLDTVRQYSRERLAETDRTDAARDQHLKFFLSLAEEAAPKLKGGEQKAWLDRLETDLENIRAALAWGLETEPVLALKLAGILGGFWARHGHFSEGRRWLEGALSAAAEAPLDVRASALGQAANLARRQADLLHADELAQECLRLNREPGSEHGAAYALTLLGDIAMSQGDHERAGALWEETLALCRTLEDKRGIASTLNNLGVVEGARGDFVRARALFEESLAIRREFNDNSAVAQTLNNLSEVCRNKHDYARARQFGEEGLAVARPLGDKEMIGYLLNNLAETVLEQNDPDHARSLQAEGLAIAKEVGDKELIAMSLEAFAKVASATGQPAQAAKLFGAAEAMREGTNVPIQTASRKDYDGNVAAVRSALGEDAFAAAWATGRAMTLDQAITYALEEQA